MPIATSESTLLLYIAHVGRKGLSHLTIRVYLSAIRSFHVAEGQHNHFTAQYIYFTPPASPSWNTKETSLYLKTKDQTPNHYSIKEENQNIDICKASYLPQHNDLSSMLHSFLWVHALWQFTSPSHSAYDPTVHLSFNDAAVDSRICPTFIRLTIKQSKTDCFRQRSFIYLGKQTVRYVLWRLSYCIDQSEVQPRVLCFYPTTANLSLEQSLAQQSQAYWKN